MYYFVTGASGRLGLVLINKLVERHQNVIALVPSNSEKTKLPEGVEAIVGDINDADQIEKGVAKSDVVIHLAGLIDYSAKWDELEKVNVKGTRTVAEACAKFKKKLIYVSTTGVYGKTLTENPANEKTPTNPSDLYAKSKLEAERVVTSYYGAFPYLIFRIGVIYGPSYFSVYSRIIKLIDKGSMMVFGDGKNVIPFVYAEDVAEALILGAKSSISSATFLISENVTLTQEKTYGLVAEYLGKTNYAPMRIPAGVGKAFAALFGSSIKLNGEDINVLSSHRIFDTERAERALGWKPSMTVVEGIREMVNIYSSKKQMNKKRLGE
mgnify:CR=1 FL=1